MQEDEGFDGGDDGVGHCDDGSECAILLVLWHAERWVESMLGKCEWGEPW